jgi:hypothetical protein
MPSTVWTFEGDTADLEAALASVRGEVQQAEGDLGGLGEAGSKGFSLTGASADKAAKVIGGVLLAGVVAATAAAVALATKVVSVAGDLDKLAKQAKRAGTTAKELDTIRGVFDLAGVSIGQTDAMVKKFRVNLGKAAIGTAAQADALDLLGTKAEDFNGLPLDRKLALVAKGMQGIEDPAIRATVATDLFGRSGLDILPLLEDGEDAWLASASAIEDAGTVTNEQAAMSEVLVDAIALMNRTIGTLVRDALVPMIPALTDVANTVRETIESFDTTRIIRWVEVMADVTSGAMLAWQALRGLDQEQRQAAVASGHAQDAINAQAEAVSALREELEAEQESIRQTADLMGTDIWVSEDVARLTEEIDHQLAILKRLRGELSTDIPGLTPTSGAPAPRSSGGGAPTPLSAPSADAPAAPAPIELDSAALDAHADAWDGVRAAIEAVERATEKVTDRQLSASERVIKAKEAEEAEIVALVNDAVSNTLLSEEQKLAIIADGNAARLALAEGLAADLDRIREEDVAAEERATDAKLSLFEKFQEAWREGLGAIVNAAGQLAIDIVGVFSDMATDTMNERIAAHRQTGREIERINGKLNDTVDEQERERLEGTKARLLERSAAEREAALEAFNTQKSLAIVAASINTALAVINAFATAPNILVGAVMAVIAGAAGAVAIASIAAEQPPSFHAGGVLRAVDIPGATSQDGLMVRKKAGEGTLSTQGVRAAGGEAGVNALNAGRSTGGGQSVNLIRVGTRTTEAISHQQLRSRTGRMAQEFRGIRPKVGRSFVGRR